MQGNELVQFAEYEEPGLKAGDYEVHATLSLKNLTPAAFATPNAEPQYSQTKYLRVLGDQYTLSPGSVESVYPPAGLSGTFSRNLPHVVLSRATLPWERTLGDAAADHTPWMTVLLMTDEELLHDGISASEPLTPAKRPGPTYEDVACRILKLPESRWKSLAPTVTELRYLAHVRKTSTALRVDNELEERKVALVMGNRLPPEGKSCWAFLVSVENRMSDMPKGDPAASVEMVVLHAWRFFAKANPRSFGAAILGLDRRVGLSLSCPPDAPEAAALNMGYVPASHSLRVGGSTWSWYRGPFTPYGTQRVLKQSAREPIASADSVLFYDPELGMMDASCAAAWTLGRLTALNDTAFAQAVQKTRRRKVRGTLERARFQLTFGRLPGTQLNATTIRTHVESSLARGLSAALTQLGGAKPGLTEALAPHLLAEREAVPMLSKRERAHFFTGAVSSLVRIQELHGVHEQMLTAGSNAGDGKDDVQIAEEAKERWLGEAAVVKQVPFHYLVPHEQMLPAESIRFFQVDLSWLEAFHDGAISLGRESETDLLHDAAFQPLLRSGVERATAVTRPQNHRLLLQGNAASQPEQPLSGILLRSEVLDAWPDMEIEGKVAGRTVKTLRQERIGGVLLCLFAEVVDGVDIHQPSEGVHFGFPLKKSTGDAEKYWRKPDGAIDLSRRLERIPYRDTQTSVLNILELLKESGALRPDELALQMVVGVDRITFNIAAPRPALTAN